MGPIIEVPNPNGGVTPVGLVSQIGSTQSQATGGTAYSISQKSGSTGLTGLAAAAPILSLRWTNALYNAVVTLFRWQFLVTTVSTVAGLLDSSLSVARSFTIADTGGVAVTLAGNDQKKRTSYKTTGMAIQMAQTTALVAGTRTLDDNPVAMNGGWLTITTLGASPDFGASIPSQFDPSQEGITLAANEGLVLAMISAMPASAVAQLYFHIEWKEIPIGGY